MGNLYVAIDESSAGRFRARTTETLQKLRDIDGYFPQAADGADLIEELLAAVFPDGMPGQFLASNLSLNDDYVLLALRPVLQPFRPWPFPAGRSLCIKGGYYLTAPQARFNILNVQEIADGPAREFEVPLDAVTYLSRPQNFRANHNALTPEFVATLPRVAEQTGERLTEWSQFLQWQEKVVLEKCQGLRFVDRRVTPQGVEFTVVARDAAALDKQLRALRRIDATAFGLGISTDEWEFRLQRQSRRGGDGPIDVQLGRLTHDQPHRPWQHPGDGPWNRPVQRTVRAAWNDERINDLAAMEDPRLFFEAMEKRLPESGFLSMSIAGELSLIDRHKRAVEQLRDQGGYAPYLAAYLFDIAKANLPVAPVEVSDWHRQDLNPSQRRAVEKILAAPDLCLVQGPPGTGKTTVIAEATLQFVRQGKKVLIASQAHLAVDNVLDRLGNVPEIRAIRLGRGDKVSEDGKPFVEDQVLKRYYTTIADACEQRYLQPWQGTEARLRGLQAWLERALPAWQDKVAQEVAVRQLRGEQEALAQQVREAEAALARVQEVNRERADQRLGLKQLAREFAAGQLSDSDMTWEHLGDQVPEVLAMLGKVGIRQAIDAEAWGGAPALQRRSFGAVLEHWRRLVAWLAQVQSDAERLRRAAGTPLVTLENAQRIGALEAEHGELMKKLESEDGEAYLARWREVQRELKGLRSAGGLDRGFYEGLLEKSALLVELGRNEPANALAWLDTVAAALTELNAAMVDWAKALAEQVAAALADLAPLSEDRTPLQACEQRLRRQEGLVAKADQLAQQRREVCVQLAAEVHEFLPAAYGGPEKALEAARTELKRLRAEAATQAQDRQEWEGLLSDWVRQLRDPKVQQADQAQFLNTYVAQCNVVAITCNENSKTLENKRHTYFDVVIIDEVSKATPPELLLPMLRGRKAVLVGDHRQLPPLFRQGSEEIDWKEAAEDSGDDPTTALTRDNLYRYERMVSASLFKEHFENAPEELRQRLEVQFRMHPQIMNVINHFYEGRLTCGLADPDAERAHGLTIAGSDDLELLTPDRHVLWVDSSYDPSGKVYWEDAADGRSLRTNRLEALLMAQFLVRLDAESKAAGYGMGSKPRRKVGVVSFYAPQLRVIREGIKELTGKEVGAAYPALEVEINTVQKYQGKEKPIVLVSLVRNFDHAVSARSNIAQYQHINVAFSRAQELLVVFGAAKLFGRFDVALPNMDRPGTTQQPVYQRILEDLNHQGCFATSRRVLGPAAFAALNEPKAKKSK